MRTCYLHAGMAKTGSTAIQHYILQNREKLLEHGLLVPETGHFPSKGNYLPLVRKLMGGRRETGGEVDLDRFDAELRGHDGDVIISSEQLGGRLLKKQSSVVVRYLKDRGFRTVLVVYLREQVMALNARYGQLVKMFRRDAEFYDFVSDRVRSGIFHYNSWVRAAQGNESDLILRPFNRTVREEGVIRDFLRAIGVDVEVVEDVRSNISLGPIAVAAALDVRREAAALGAFNARQRSRCRRALINAVEHSPPEPRSFCGFDEADAVRLRETFAEDNDALARGVWGKSWEEAFGPPEPVRRNVFDPATASEADRARFDELVAQASSVIGISRDHVPGVTNGRGRGSIPHNVSQAPETDAEPTALAPQAASQGRLDAQSHMGPPTDQSTLSNPKLWRKLARRLRDHHTQD